MQSAEVSATFCATLVDEWRALGVRLAVVAPGSRSTPMAIAIADSDLRTEIFHDERSAAFAALGAAKASGVPTVLLCTSGTAAVNFHPAVVEASYAEVPLIVVTADRPPELQGSRCAADHRPTQLVRLVGCAVTSTLVSPTTSDVMIGGAWRDGPTNLQPASLPDPCSEPRVS